MTDCTDTEYKAQRVRWTKLWILNGIIFLLYTGAENQAVSSESNMKITELTSVIIGRISVAKRMSEVGWGRIVELRALTLQWLKKTEAIGHYLQQKMDNQDTWYLLKCAAIFLGYFDGLFRESILLQRAQHSTLFEWLFCVKWEATAIARCWWPSAITSSCITTNSNTTRRM